ncbi:MAG: hypothetical protein ABI425_01305 [Patescibacteria group bacterium]
MAQDFHHIFHDVGTEEQIWHALLNEHNLESALSIDSKLGMHPHKGYEFRWIVDGQQIVGQLGEIDTPGTSSTHLIFLWRFDDRDLREIWPEGHFATTTLILGDQYIDLKITNIPGREEEQNRSRKLWSDRIIERLSSYLRNKPELERAE